MATEVDRKPFGVANGGAVVVIHKVHYSDDGEKQISTYEIVQGNHALGLYDSRTQAENVAKALVGKVLPADAPVEEPAVEAPSRGRR